MKKRNIFLAITIGGLIFVVKEIFNAADYVVSLALTRGDKGGLARCINLEKEVTTLKADDDEEGSELEKWIEGVRKISCTIRSYDNYPLFGEIFLQEKHSHKWVIIVHGYATSGRSMAYAAKKFYEKGYNIVMPDLRCHGKSGGEYIGMGWQDRLDVVEWIRKITNGNKDCEITLYGVSMGGATVLMAGGEKLPKNVVAIVADCSYKSAMAIFEHQLKEVFHFPPHPFIDVVNIVCKKRTGHKLSEMSVTKQIKKCKIPILFCHGDIDNLVPTSMVYKLYDAAKCKKDILVIKGAGHGVSALVGKRAYWDKVFKFIDSI